MSGSLASLMLYGSTARLLGCRSTEPSLRQRAPENPSRISTEPFPTSSTWWYTANVSDGSVCPIRYTARLGGRSQTARIEANVRRSECGVTWPIRSRPSDSRTSLARSSIGARIRARMLSGRWRVPLRVGKAGRPGRLGHCLVCATRRRLSAGTIGTVCSPASVFVVDLGMRTRPRPPSGRNGG